MQAQLNVVMANRQASIMPINSKIDIASVQGITNNKNTKRKQPNSPKTVKKRLIFDEPSTSNAALISENRFSLLVEEDEDYSELPAPEAPVLTDQQTTPKPRPPPIWCPNIKSVALLQQIIDKVIDAKSYVIKPKKNNIGV